MTSTNPIGVFDSGLGGLSVLAQLHSALPQEDFIYLGDSAHAPYGVKTPEEILKRCREIIQYFLTQDAKMVVIACNTATAAAAKTLREEHPDLPIIGMEPALKVPLSAQLSRPQRIVVAATALTLHEQKFQQLLNTYGKGHEVICVPCPKLVEIIENQDLENSAVVNQAIEEYFTIAKEQPTDAVVLGCTHFVFYRKVLRTFLDEHTQIIDGNEGTVHHVIDVLSSHQSLASKDHCGSIRIMNTLSSQHPEILDYSHYLLGSLYEHAQRIQN